MNDLALAPEYPAISTNEYLSIRGVMKGFDTAAGQMIALSDINLDVKRGEFISFIGHSGCGKSTLLNIVAGLSRQTSGEVMLNGKPILGPGPDRGVVFQNYSLLPWLSVRENVFEAVDAVYRTKTRPEKHSLVDDFLNKVGLAEHRDKRPSQISGGMKQRVAIARAFATHPEVMLLDEPFGAVDAKIRHELREWLVTLHEDLNVTTIFVTHDQEEAMEVANRIVIFSRGNLEQIGTPREVYEQPANEFVARFIGVMNVLEAEVKGGVARVGELQFSVPDQSDGARLRIGFRPYAVQMSTDLNLFPYRAVLRRTFFLGIMLRLELELPSGLILRSRMTKEEYAQLGLEDDREISFQIRNFRVLAAEAAGLPPEQEIIHQPPPTIAEHI